MNKPAAWITAAALLVPMVCGVAAVAGPQGVIDNFSDTSLSEYTASYILEQSSVNAISFASPSGVLQVSKGTDPNEGSTAGAEQVVFLRDDYTLGVNEILRVDTARADTTNYVDFGIVVANTVDPADAVWTSGTADVRSGVLAIYLKPSYDNIGWLGRDGNAVPGANVGSSSGASPAVWANVTGLYIQRKSNSVFSGGWTDAANYHPLVEWTVTDTNIGSAVGFFADLRPADIPAYGDLDNLRIAPLTPGDVDGDGDVDMTDFGVIQGNFYDSATQRSEGDLNGDGIVNFADFREWKDNYPGAGAGALVGAAVPEPASWLLVCICAGLLLAVRRTRPVMLCCVVAVALACAPAATAGPVGTVDDFSSGSLTSYTFSRVNDGNTASNVSLAIGAGQDLRVSYSGAESHEQVLLLRDDYTLDVGQSLVADVVGTLTSGEAWDLGIAVAYTETPPALAPGASGDIRKGYAEVSWRGNNQVVSIFADAGPPPSPSSLVAGQEFAGTAYGGDTFNTTDPLSLYITRLTTTDFELGWIQNGTQHALTYNGTARMPYVFATNIPGPAVGFYSDKRTVIAQSSVGLDNLRIAILAQVDGDVDGDGNVDLDDYAIIESNLFDSATLRTEGDLNGDGIVDFLDFREWKANYTPPGAGALEGGAVPEPASALLWTICLVMVGVACGRRTRAIPLVLVLLCGAIWCSPAAAQALYTDWTNAGTGNWTDTANWSGGTVPDVNTEDFARIGNGGTATIGSVVAQQAGGVLLGVNNTGAAGTGTLLIQNGGRLDVVDDSLGYPADGSMRLGLTDAGAASGTGVLTISPGGRLDSVSLLTGGQVGSTLTLGGVTPGATTVNTGSVTLGRTTRVIGPNVNFSATGALAFGGTSVLQAEITGATHSALKTTGAATLDGALEVEFNSYTPTGADTWNLVDAASVGGNFASVALTSGSLPAGKALAVRTQAGGANGFVAQLYVQQLLVLNVNRDTGAISISNPGSAGISLDGYGVRSAAGSLDAAGWNSLEDQAVAGWSEANPSPNHIGELKATGVSTLGAGMSWSLGNIYSQAAPSEFGQNTEDLTFLYTWPERDSVQSVVQYTGTESINNLVLYVDPSNGEVGLRNTSPFTVDIEGYTVASAGGALQPANGDWISLDDQNAEGGTWYEANASATRVSELQASGVTTLNPNRTFSLGTLYDTAGAEDLIFEFLLAGESDPMLGAVRYEALPSLGVIGDYNDDGTVDAADYTVWRDNLGGDGSALANRDPANSGPISEDDFTSWKAHFGETAGSGSSLAVGSAVPEPASWILLCISGALMLAVRRTARTQT